jgi:type VI secretion system secreted protein Hcp
MAFDTYVYFEGKGKIDGETTDHEFGPKKAFEIFSFSFGASNPTTVGSASGGLTGGKVSLSSFSMMKKTDASSAALFNAVAAGVSIDKMIVVLRKAGGDKQLKFITFTFEEVMIESIQWSGSSGGDDTPTESLSAAFRKVTIGYQPQGKDGAAAGGEKTASWDVGKNTK